MAGINLGIDTGLWNLMAKNGDKPQKVADLSRELGIDPDLLSKLQMLQIVVCPYDIYLAVATNRWDNRSIAASPGCHGLHYRDRHRRVSAHKLYQGLEHPYNLRWLSRNVECTIFTPGVFLGLKTGPSRGALLLNTDTVFFSSTGFPSAVVQSCSRSMRGHAGGRILRMRKIHP